LYGFFYNIKLKDKNVIISEGHRPFWQIILATLFYTLAILLLAIFFFGYEAFLNRTGNAKGDFSLLYIGFMCISQGILFSVVKNIHFDLGLKKVKEEHQVGPIKIGKWKNLPEIKYVSIFRQPKADGAYIFEVNLWYKRNKHFNIYQNTHLETVVLMGRSIAQTLNVDLWDATVPQKEH
jgi:hypothetical protein